MNRRRLLVYSAQLHWAGDCITIPPLLPKHLLGRPERRPERLKIIRMKPISLPSAVHYNYFFAPFGIVPTPFSSKKRFLTDLDDKADEVVVGGRSSLFTGVWWGIEGKLKSAGRSAFLSASRRFLRRLKSIC